MPKFEKTSINVILGQIKDTFLRFPFTQAVVFLATAVFLLMTWHNYYSEPSYFNILLKIALISSVSAFLLLAAELFSEREKEVKFKLAMTLRLTIVALAVGAYFLLPKNIFDLPGVWTIQYGIFCIFSIILVFLAPFLRRQESNGLWQWCYKIGKSLLIALIFTGVLYIGLQVAIVAIRTLFELHFRTTEWTFRLFIFMAGIVGSSLFLSGFPKSLNALEGESETDNRLRYFGQYVLLPLWAVYLAILYTYFLKVIVTDNWPKGMVVYLIVAYYSLGLAANYFLYPFQTQLPWLKKFFKGSFALSLPLIGVYFWALSFRLSAYGLTTNRYLTLAFGVWMAAISIYHLFAKSINLRVIFYSFAAGLIVISVGPWGAVSLPRHLQYSRLEQILTQNGMLVDGKIVKVDGSRLPCAVKKDITERVRYLLDEHGAKSLRFLGTTAVQYEFKSGKIFESLGFVGTYYCGGYDKRGMPDMIDDNTEQGAKKEPVIKIRANDEELWKVLDVRDFQYVVMVEDNTTTGFNIGNKNYKINFDRNKGVFTLLELGTLENATVDLNPLLSDMAKSYTKTDQSSYGPFVGPDLQVKFDSRKFSGQMVFTSLIYDKEGDKLTVDSFNGKMLLNIK